MGELTTKLQNTLSVIRLEITDRLMDFAYVSLTVNTWQYFNSEVIQVFAIWLVSLKFSAERAQLVHIILYLLEEVLDVIPDWALIRLKFRVALK